MKEVTRDPKGECGRRLIPVIVARRQEREREKWRIDIKRDQRALFDTKNLPLLKP